MRSTIVLGGAAAITLIVGTVYLVQKRPAESSSVATMPTDAAIPTPEYLLAHPDLLKSGEQKCQHNTDPSSLYCTNVQRAESVRLADQYRRAGQQQGSAQ